MPGYLFPVVGIFSCIQLGGGLPGPQYQPVLSGKRIGKTELFGSVLFTQKLELIGLQRGECAGEHYRGIDVIGDAPNIGGRIDIIDL